MNSWQKVEFKDFITLQRGFDLPVDNIVEGDVPVFGSNTIIGYHNVYKVEGPGVITGRSGTLGIVQYAEGPFWPHNTSLWVKDFKGNVPKFVYYKLKTLNLNQFSSGASVPTLNRNNLDNISILIPRNKAQKRIADLLSVYDDLIDNNRKRIDLLEESARELYKEWFVRLRFPGYEKTKIVNGVPEGWERKKLRDVIELRYGKSLKEENRSDGPYPVYGSSGEIGRHRDFLVEGPGIIVGRKGNAGTVFWSHENFFPIDTTYYIMNSQSDYYVYHNLCHQNFQSSHGAVPGLNRDYAYNLPILMPSLQLRSQFLESATPMHQQCHKLTLMNARLSEARDILLPKLMNGEIEL